MFYSIDGYGHHMQNWKLEGKLRKWDSWLPGPVSVQNHLKKKKKKTTNDVNYEVGRLPRKIFSILTLFTPLIVSQSLEIG